VKWLLSLLIAVQCIAQPLDRIIDAKTPAELVRIMDDWTRGRPMGLHTATFDNGMTLTGSMAATFDRDTAAYVYTYSGAATASSADTPRYGEDVLVFGAPTFETINAVSANGSSYNAGNTYDGDALVMMSYGNGDGTSTLIIYTDGSTPTASVTRDMDASLGGFTKPATEDDLLAGEATEEEDYMYQIAGMDLYRGFMIAWCHVKTYDGSGDRDDEANWIAYGFGACISTDGGSTWSRHFRCREDNYLTTTDTFGQLWSGKLMVRTRAGTDSDEVWAVLTNYNAGSARSASTYLFRATYSAGWTAEAAHRWSHTVVNATQTHAHVAVLSGSKLLTYIGDTFTDGRTEETVCSDIADYLAGATDRANASGVKENGTNWSALAIVEGSTGATGMVASQIVGCAEAIEDGAFALGGDEEYGTPINIMRMTATAGDHPNQTRGYGYTTTNAELGNWRSFTLNAWDKTGTNPAVAGNITPGNGWATGNHAATRIVYKPAGETAFGIVAALTDEDQNPEQIKPVLSPAGYIWWASKSGNGLRRFQVPTTWRKQRAIRTGPGATNHAMTTPVVRTAAHATNTVTIGAVPPHAAPSNGAVVRFQAAASSSNMGHYRISTDSLVANAHTWLHVVVWVYSPEWDGSTYTNIAPQFWRANFYTHEHGTAGEQTGLLSPRRVSVRGAWVRLEWQLHNDAAGDWDIATAYTTESIQLVMQLQANNSTVHPQDFYMVVAGVYPDGQPPSYDPPTVASGSGAGDNESLVLSGFSCGNTWTAYLVGIVPDSGRDTLWHGAGTHRAVATLYESATKYIEIRLDADDEFQVHVQDGATNPDFTSTGGPLLIRGDPIIVQLNWDGDAYACTYSVGGSAARTLTMGSGARVSPVSLKLSSNQDGSAFESMGWLYAAIDDSEAKDDPGFIGSGKVGTNGTNGAGMFFYQSAPGRQKYRRIWWEE
jgi:hypothetical protein